MSAEESVARFRDACLGAVLRVGAVALAVVVVYFGASLASVREQPWGRLALAFGVGAAFWLLVLSTLSRALKPFAPQAVGSRTATEDYLSLTNKARALPTKVAAMVLVQWVGGGVLAGAALAVFDESIGEAFLRLSFVVTLVAMAAGGTVFLSVQNEARNLLRAVSGEVGVKVALDGIAPGGAYFTARMVLLSGVLLILGVGAVLDQLTQVTRSLDSAVRGAEGAELTRAVDDYRFRMVVTVVVLLGVLVLVAVAIARLMARALIEPLQEVAAEAKLLSEGTMRSPRLIAAEDEGWTVTATFVRTQLQLHEVVTRYSQAAGKLALAKGAVSSAARLLEETSTGQAASLNETSATTEELAQSAKQISHNAESVADIAESTSLKAREGQEIAEAFAGAVERMKADNRTIADAVDRLQKRVQQIGKIVEFINTIAGRADLLALSAELEGTKAGDVGRGFGLVAAEMRRLAENVMESTSEIVELITEIRDATRVTVEVTEQGLRQTESGTSLAANVVASLARVVDLAERTAESVKAISLATQQQQSGTDQLAEAMADILGNTQSGLTATKQLVSANDELGELTDRALALVGRFKLVA